MGTRSQEEAVPGPHDAGAPTGRAASTTAQKLYEWLLERDDSRPAKVGLAAVHEDLGRHAEALELYERVLRQSPQDAYALRGLARTLSSLGRTDEAVETFYRAAAAPGGKDANLAASVAVLKTMSSDLRRAGDTDRAEWIDIVLWRLRGE